MDQELKHQNFAEVPVVALVHSQPMDYGVFGFAEEEANKIESFWLEAQHEIVSRSEYGKVMVVEGGHNLMFDNPQAIIEAVRDVMRNK